MNLERSQPTQNELAILAKFRRLTAHQQAIIRVFIEEILKPEGGARIYRFPSPVKPSK